MENSFASRLKFLRGKESREKFAKLVGLSPRALVNYENGTRVFKSNFVSQICVRLGVNINWLLTGEGPVRQFDAQEGSNQNRRHVGGFETSLNTQPTENINMKKNKTADMSAVLYSDMSEVEGGETGSQPGILEVIGLQQEISAALRKGMELQDRLLAATEQVAELRLQLQARDQRIRDLEKENAQLREAQKGNTYPGAGVAGIAS